MVCGRIISISTELITNSKLDGIMTFVEAIKKAYEKACDLKSKNTEGYSGYVTIHCGIYSLNVYAYGGVDFDLSGCSVNDLTGDYWKLVE